MASTTLTKSLTGKVAVISGSSSGIGLAIAAELASRGARVVLNYPFPSLKQECDAAVKTLPPGTQSITVCADLSTPEGPQILVDAAVARFHQINILVNNAGVVPMAPFESASLADLEAVYNLNIRGTFLLTKATLPHLSVDGHSRIINICSATSRHPEVTSAVYASSKAAVDTLSKTWAKDLPPTYRCTVNAVAPGPISTPGMLKNIGDHKDFLMDMFDKMTPVEGGVGTAEDVAWTVAFLAEERSRWINGQFIYLSGGMHLA